MSEKRSDAERLVELLAEEQRWLGKYYGHQGQAKVASEEMDLAEKMIQEAIMDEDEDARKYWERRRKKAKARKEYHIKETTQAWAKLAEVRREIRNILRRGRI